MMSQQWVTREELLSAISRADRLADKLSRAERTIARQEASIVHGVNERGRLMQEIRNATRPRTDGQEEIR